MSPTDTHTPAILQVLPALNLGGVERGTLEVASAIHAQGWRSLVASAGGKLVSTLEETSTHVTIKGFARKTPLTLISNTLALIRLIRSENISLVHARSRWPAWSAYAACRWCKIPLITTYHGTYGQGTRLKRYYNSVMTKGQTVIAISEFIADYIKTYHRNMPAEHIRVIPRGVDLEVFNPAHVPATAVANLKTAWKIPEHTPVLLLPGRLSRWKGHVVAIQALNLIKDIACHLVILGDQTPGAYTEQLHRLIDTLNLKSRVSFVQQTTDMQTAYMAADYVLVPSTKPEAFGRVIVEAGCMGRVVIASEHGGALETIIHGETGYLVHVADREDLARALKHVLSMPASTYQRMATQAREHCRTHYALQDMLAQTLDVYRKALCLQPRQ